MPPNETTTHGMPSLCETENILFCSLFQLRWHEWTLIYPDYYHAYCPFWVLPLWKDSPKIFQTLMTLAWSKRLIVSCIVYVMWGFCCAMWKEFIIPSKCIFFHPFLLLEGISKLSFPFPVAFVELPLLTHIFITTTSFSLFKIWEVFVCLYLMKVVLSVSTTPCFALVKEPLHDHSCRLYWRTFLLISMRILCH